MDASSAAARRGRSRLGGGRRARTGAPGCCAFSYKTNVSHIKGTSFYPGTYRRECPLICQHNIFSARPACNISWPRVAVCRPPHRLRQIIFVHVRRYGAHLDIFPLTIPPLSASLTNVFGWDCSLARDIVAHPEVTIWYEFTLLYNK